MKPLAALVSILMACSLAAEDTPVELGRKAFLLTVPEGLAAGKLYRPEIIRFSQSLFGDAEAFLAPQAELDQAKDGKPDFHRFVVAVDPNAYRFVSMSPDDFQYNYVEPIKQSLPPFEAESGGADAGLTGLLQEIRTGSKLSRLGEEEILGVLPGTETAVSVLLVQNFGGSRFYQERRPMLVTASQILATDRLLRVFVVADLNGSADLDWVLKTTRGLYTAVVPMVR